jgi:hypothetical protein
MLLKPHRVRRRCSENPMDVLSGRESEKIETVGCYSVLAMTLRSRLSGIYGGFVIGCATSSEFSQQSDNVHKISRKEICTRFYFQDFIHSCRMYVTSWTGCTLEYIFICLLVTSNEESQLTSVKLLRLVILWFLKRSTWQMLLASDYWTITVQHLFRRADGYSLGELFSDKNLDALIVFKIWAQDSIAAILFIILIT